MQSWSAEVGDRIKLAKMNESLEEATTEVKV
jgi:hypothetical protein